MRSQGNSGIIYRINVKAETPGERGLPKHPIQRAFVKRTGLVGDFNRWRHEEAQDDPGTAVLLMPLEMIEELNREGWRIEPGDVGENFTTKGIPYDAFAPSKRYRLGEARITISKPCDPCSNLYLLSEIGKDQDIVKAMYKRRGWYARVDEEGEVATGDSVKEIV